MDKSKALMLLAAKGVLGASLALGFATSPTAPTPVTQAAPAPAAVCFEDQPCWSCVDDGNRVCGPENDEGKPAGCYDQGGVLVEVWPCSPVPSGVFADPDESVYLTGYIN